MRRDFNIISIGKNQVKPNATDNFERKSCCSSLNVAVNTDGDRPATAVVSVTSDRTELRVHSGKSEGYGGLIWQAEYSLTRQDQRVITVFVTMTENP
jgi:hypothetical protein